MTLKIKRHLMKKMKFLTFSLGIPKLIERKKDNSSSWQIYYPSTTIIAKFFNPAKRNQKKRKDNGDNINQWWSRTYW